MTQKLDVVEIPQGSIEFVKATATADVALADAITVVISLTPLGTHDHDWMAAGWTGAAATQRVARTTEPVTFEVGTYLVHLQLTDNPEVPILAAYVIRVV